VQKTNHQRELRSPKLNKAGNCAERPKRSQLIELSAEDCMGGLYFLQGTEMPVAGEQIPEQGYMRGDKSTFFSVLLVWFTKSQGLLISGS
jgi:hypothetical protein